MTSIVPATVRDAVVLAEAGLPVFPCTLQKAPMTANGFKDATRQPDGDVYAYKDRGDGSIWYGRWPDGDTLLGVPTGAASGLVVIDVDTYKVDSSSEPTVGAIATQAWLYKRRDLLNTARIHRTGSGGYHYIFRLPRWRDVGGQPGHANDPERLWVDGREVPPNGFVPIKSRAGIRVGGQTLSYIDVRADGGYVIWWAAHGCDCSQPGDSMAGKRSLADAVAAIPVLPPELLADLLESCRETSVAPPTDAAKRDPMVAAFQERGLYRREKAPGLHCVTCPWIEEHPGGIQHADDTSVYFEAHFNGRGHAAYVCKDASCDGKRSLRLLREKLHGEAVDGGSHVVGPVDTAPERTPSIESHARLPATIQDPAEDATQWPAGFSSDDWIAQIDSAYAVGGLAAAVPRCLDWTEQLMRSSNNAVMPTIKNALVGLGYSPQLLGAFVYDEFLCAPMVTRRLPHFDAEPPFEWVDDLHAAAVMSWLNRFGLKVTKEQVCDGVRLLSYGRRMNSARNYFESLSWDGTPRLDTWLSTYLGAEGNHAYLSRVGRWFLAGVAARACAPGAKQDYTLVLIMKQGIGKTTVAEVLAVKPDWFTDRMSALGSKDTLMELRGRLIVEMAELEVFRKSDVETQKAFLTSRVDKYRPPYARSVLSFPRTCCFVGTTNEGAFLHDLTGNRRFWPVKCGETIDIDGLRRDINQLYAEAYQMIRRGDRHWPIASENPIFELEQERFRIVTPLEEILATLVMAEPPAETLTNDQLYTHLGAYTPRDRAGISRQVTALMRKWGFRECSERVDGKKARLWRRGSDG